MVPTCRHIMPSNSRCQSPAVHDQHYCYHHRQVKILTRRPPRRRHDFTHIIPFVFAEDRAAIQINLHLVNQALAEGRIDTRTANAYTSNIRVAAINLRQGPLTAPLTATLAQSNAENHSARNPNLANIVRRVILTPEGDEIAPPREALEPGEQSPLHHKDCPCRRCAEQFRSAPPEQHHPDCQCGLCEPATNLNKCHPERTGAPDTRDVRVTGWGSEGPAVSQPGEEASVPSAPSVVKNDAQILAQGCHPERSEGPSFNGAGLNTSESAKRERLDGQSFNPIEPLRRACPELLRRSIRVQVEGQGFSPAINTTLRRSDLSAEGPSAAEPGSPARGLGVLGWEGEASAPFAQNACAGTASPKASQSSRIAPATKLYDQELTKDPVNQPFNLADYLYGDAHKKHEAQYAARARAAIEAGLEPPPYEPFDPAKVESEDDRRYREDREQIERNREAARLAWNKLHPDEPVSYTPYLTWGEQHDLKLAQAKKQKEEEEARARAESLPAPTGN